MYSCEDIKVLILVLVRVCEVCNNKNRRTLERLVIRATRSPFICWASRKPTHQDEQRLQLASHNTHNTQARVRTPDSLQVMLQRSTRNAVKQQFLELSPLHTHSWDRLEFGFGTSSLLSCLLRWRYSFHPTVEQLVANICCGSPVLVSSVALLQCW